MQGEKIVIQIARILVTHLQLKKRRVKCLKKKNTQMHIEIRSLVIIYYKTY